MAKIELNSSTVNGRKAWIEPEVTSLDVSLTSSAWGIGSDGGSANSSYAVPS